MERIFFKKFPICLLFISPKEQFHPKKIEEAIFSFKLLPPVLFVQKIVTQWKEFFSKNFQFAYFLSLQKNNFTQKKLKKQFFLLNYCRQFYSSKKSLHNGKNFFQKISNLPTFYLSKRTISPKKN